MSEITVHLDADDVIDQLDSFDVWYYFKEDMLDKAIDEILMNKKLIKRILSQISEEDIKEYCK